MYRVIHGRLNSLTWNHGHRGAEDGKELHKREADDRSCVDFQLPPLRNVPGSPADVVIPGGTSRTRKDKGQRQSGCTGGRGGARAMVGEGERYRREVGGEAVKNFRRTADFLGCCELKAVKTL